MGNWGGVLLLGDLPGVPSCKLSQAGVADGAAQACGEPLALLVSVFLGFPPQGKVVSRRVSEKGRLFLVSGGEVLGGSLLWVPWVLLLLHGCRAGGWNTAAA